MMVGWEEKARSIKTGHWAEGFCHFLGQGLSTRVKGLLD
jgi:hypothetical protein